MNTGQALVHSVSQGISEVPSIWQVLGKVLDSIYFSQVPRCKYFHRESICSRILSKQVTSTTYLAYFWV